MTLSDVLHFFDSINWLDYTGIALLLLSMIFSATRGFIQSAMSLIGWGVAFFAAHFLSSWLTPFLTFSGLGENSRYVMSFIVIFIVTLLVWSLATVAVKNTVNGVGLGGLDRLLGGLFGFIRAATVLVVLSVLVNVTPFAEAPTWKESIGVKLAKEVAQTCKPYLPEKFAGLIR